MRLSVYLSHNVSCLNVSRIYKYTTLSASTIGNVTRFIVPKITGSLYFLGIFYAL